MLNPAPLSAPALPPNDPTQSTREALLAELQATQTMLIHAERMSTLGQVVAGITHEINNPLAFVNSNIHALQQMVTELVAAYTKLEQFTLSVSTPENQAATAALRAEADLDFLCADLAEVVTASLTGLARVRKIIEEMRTFSRLDAGNYEPTDLRAAIESCLVLAQAELKNRIQVEVALDNLPPLKGRPAELNQVFLNLILNAAQAIAEQGKITIRGQQTAQSVILTFSDTGCGMTPATLQQIFRPFFTTKPAGQGTGLGLAIVHKIITVHHGGAIEVSSAPGRGTTFTLYLPKELPL